MNRLFPLALAALCLTAPASASSFQHIILVIQENRTPDNLFQGLCTTRSACKHYARARTVQHSDADGYSAAGE